MAGSEGASLLLEPAFPFHFEGGEGIETELLIRICSADGVREGKIAVEWHPIVVRLRASIV